jgi:hypothetical protein
MNRKAYLKDPYFDMPPVPFNRWDYLLCVVACFLAGIAFVPGFTALILPAAK